MTYDLPTCTSYPVPPLRRASCASRCTAAHRQGHRAVATRCRFPLGRRPQRSLCPFPTRVSSSSSRRQARFLRHFRPTSPRRRCRSAACDSALRHRSGLILPRARRRGRYASEQVTSAVADEAAGVAYLGCRQEAAAAPDLAVACRGEPVCTYGLICRPLAFRPIDGSLWLAAEGGGELLRLTTRMPLPAAVAVAASRMVPLVGSARLC